VLAVDEVVVWVFEPEDDMECEELGGEDGGVVEVGSVSNAVVDGMLVETKGLPMTIIPSG
jgi:hypothetical protein